MNEHLKNARRIVRETHPDARLCSRQSTVHGRTYWIADSFGEWLSIQRLTAATAWMDAAITVLESRETAEGTR